MTFFNSIGSLLKRVWRTARDPSAHEAYMQQAERFVQEAHRADIRKEFPEQFAHETQSPEFVVTTVHGTFAHCATWINEDSRLAWHLRSSLKRPIYVRPFTWSGDNSVSARERAASDLRIHLRDLLDRWPDSCHVIIAHSHGGNVVLQALDEPELAHRVAGVACLATPFLTAAVNEPEFHEGGRARRAAAVWAGLASSLYVAKIVGSAWGRTLLVLVPLAVLSGLKLVDQIAEFMYRRAVWVAERIVAPAIAPEKLAIIRTPGDEAAALLAGVRLVGWIFDAMWRLLFGPLLQFRRIMSSNPPTAEWSERDFWFKFLHLSVYPTIGALLIDQPSADSWVRILGLLLVVGYGMPALLMLLSGVVALPLSLFIALGRWPCGREVFLAGPFLELTAEPAPPGTWRVTQVAAHESALELKQEKGISLSHSRAHDDFIVHRRLAEWLTALGASNVDQE